MNEGFGGLQPKRVVGKAEGGCHGGQALGARGTKRKLTRRTWPGPD